MLGAATAVALLYAGGGMMLNLAGFEFPIPGLPEEPKTIVIEAWEPLPPPTPLENAPVSAPVMSEPVYPIPAEAIEPVTATPLNEPAIPFSPALNIPVDPGPVAPTPVTPATPAAPPAPPVIRNPSWLSRPTATQLGRLYPDRAAERGISGAATMECRVTAQGTVTACLVVSESPKNYGFGEAALASTRFFRMSPRTVDGQTVEGARVRIPMGFNLE